MEHSAKQLIGLTGGIATGKTTVSNYLSEQYNLPVLDADIYAREAVSQSSLILQAIFNRYGDRMKLPTGDLDRSALGEIIFNDAAEKQWLENQIHPFVRDRFTQELEKLGNDTLVLSIPLLFEANLTALVTEIWVVTCGRTLQISRLQQRNGLTSQQAEARINSQMPIAQKAALADLVLTNSEGLPELYAQIDVAMQQYLA